MFTDSQLLEKVNIYLSHLIYGKQPEGLYNPIKYAMSLGGKRIRPVLMLMAYNLYRDDVDCILSQAAGVETYHNFTLLHDDLMDNADLRRGKPTVHAKWSKNAAILSGDAMMLIAYRLMTDEGSKYVPSVMRVFSQAALEVCEGQQYDMDFETRMDVSEDEYLEMIRLKTSVLLAASLKIGALLADAPDSAPAWHRILGYAYEELDRRDEAISQYEQAIAQGDLQSYSALAFLYYHRGNIALYEEIMEEGTEQGSVDCFFYKALCYGRFEPSEGTLDFPIARRPNSVMIRDCTEDGKPSVTHYKTLSYFESADISLVGFELETGRCHQIRTHCCHVGHPLLSDGLYGPLSDDNPNEGLRQQALVFDGKVGRVALHAYKIEYKDPFDNGNIKVFEAPLPSDMQALVDEIS